MKLVSLCRRQRLHTFFEARIAAERVPDREQFQGAVAQHDRCVGSTQPSFQLLQGKLLLARPRCRDGEILKDETAVADTFSTGVSAIARWPSSKASSFRPRAASIKPRTQSAGPYSGCACTIFSCWGREPLQT